jgi:O-antigen/teichoic acid export membrane protein
MMGTILTSTDTLLLGYFSTTGDVGVYNAVYPLARLLNAVMMAFGFIYMPLVSELDSGEHSEQIRQVYQVIVKWVAFFNLPLFLILISFPGMVISITYGSEYESGALALSVLALGFLAHSVLSLSNNTLQSIGHPRAIMYANVVAAILNIVLNITLIPRYAFLGAAIATTISYLVMNVGLQVLLYRRSGLQPLTSSMLLPAGMSIVAFGLLYVSFITLFETTLVNWLVFLVVCMVLYPVIILRYGGIDNEEVMIVRSIEEHFGINLSAVKNFAHRFINE